MKNDEYNPADYGDKSSGLSMDATVQESLTVQKQEALAALNEFRHWMDLTEKHTKAWWTIRKYIEGN